MKENNKKSPPVKKEEKNPSNIHSPRFGKDIIPDYNNGYAGFKETPPQTNQK